MLAAEDDKLTISGFCLALQRIGLSHWSAEGILRSWGVAPIMVMSDRVVAPCAVDEAIWFGFWLEADAESATVSVKDEASGLHACERCPGSFQLTALSNGSAQPICRGANRAAQMFSVEVAVIVRSGNTARERFRLCLLDPLAWATEARRPVPPRLTGPPSLPPRLG